MVFTLPQQMVRTVGVFQGLLALPILLFTVAVALEALAYSDNYVYEFTSVLLSIPITCLISKIEYLSSNNSRLISVRLCSSVSLRRALYLLYGFNAVLESLAKSRCISKAQSPRLQLQSGYG